MPEIEEIVDISSENISASNNNSSGESYRGPCAVCNKTENTKQCAKCKCVAYCSRACQVTHWRAGHKQDCPSLGAAHMAAASKAAHEAKRVQQARMEAALTKQGAPLALATTSTALSTSGVNEDEELVDGDFSEMSMCAACACTCVGCAAADEDDEDPSVRDDNSPTNPAILSAMREVPLALPGTAAAAATSPGAPTPQNVAADDAAAAAMALGGVAAAMRAEGAANSPLTAVHTAVKAALAVAAPQEEEDDKCGVCLLPKQFEQHTLACGHSYCAACVEALERHSVEYLCPWDTCRTPAALKLAASKIEARGGGDGSGGGATNNHHQPRVPVYGAPRKRNGWSNRSYSSNGSIGANNDDDEDVEYVPSEPEAQNEAAARMYVVTVGSVKETSLFFYYPCYSYKSTSFGTLKTPSPPFE